MTNLTLDQLRQLTSDSKILAGDEFLISDAVKVFFVSVKSDFGSGHKTVYSYTLNGGTERANKDITILSKDIVKEGARVNVDITYTKKEYNGSDKCTKFLNDTELSERIDKVNSKFANNIADYVNKTEGVFDLDKLCELKNNVLSSVAELCKYVETGANELRQKKATEETTKKVANKLQGLDLSLLSDELKEQLRKQLGL